METITKNRGIIRMSSCIMKDAILWTLLFEYFTVLKLDIDFYTGHYYLLMESELFEEATEGERMPEYEITIKDENGNIFIDEVKRIK